MIATACVWLVLRSAFWRRRAIERAYRNGIQFPFFSTVIKPREIIIMSRRTRNTIVVRRPVFLWMSLRRFFFLATTQNQKQTLQLLLLSSRVF